MKDETVIEGALTGAALAAAIGFSRSDDETQRRVRRNQHETAELGSDFRSLVSNGSMQRLRLAVVQDALAGISVANQQAPVPTLTPTTVQVTRPDLAQNMLHAVQAMNFPPVPGQYNQQGFIESVGELSTLFASLCYEEIRAIIQGFVQSAQPTEEQRVQCYNMANALVMTLYKLDLSKQQYADCFARLFGLALGNNQDPHADPNLAPRIINVDPTIASVVPLGTPNIAAHPYATWNTDYANKWRVTTVAAGAPASTPVFTVQYGSEFRKPGPGGSSQSYQPVVASQFGTVFTIQSTSSVGFVVKTSVGLPGSTSFDVGFGTFAG